VSYFGLTNIILPIFLSCDEDKYMARFPWIPCLWSNAQYTIIMALGITFFIVYVVGVFVFIVAYLYLNKKESGGNDPMDFLYNEKGNRWFEVFYMLRRILLSCILVFISDKLIQITAIVVLLVSFYVVSNKKPLKEETWVIHELDKIASITVLFTSLLMASGAGSVHEYVVFLFVCITLVVFMICVYPLKNQFHLLWSRCRGRGYNRL